MLKKWILLCFTTAFVLAACHSPVYNQTEGNVADVKLKIRDDVRKQDASVKPASPLVMKNGAYVDMTPISLEKQPSWLKGHIVLRGDQLPFSYYSRTISNGAASNILTKFQSGLDPSVVLAMSYSGTVKGALDLLASKTGYVYSVRGNTIYWQSVVTRTFDIAFMPGTTDYLMGKASGGGAATAGAANATTSNYTTSDSSDSEYSSMSGKLSIWTDLDTTIKQLLTPSGQVTVSQATTSVTVRDKPTNVELIGQYIANLNRNLTKQVLIKVQILDVTLQNDFDFGINWGLIANAFKNSPFQVNADYGTPVSIKAVGTTVPLVFGTQGNGQTPSYTILFNALNQQGKTSVVTEPRVVCLNNQVSVVRIVEQEGYVASIENTSTGGGGTSTAAQNTVTSQVTPGNLITGLTLYILPKILGKDVYMQVNADLSTNRGFTVLGGTVNPNITASQIQLPNIGEKHFNQRSVIRSGDTLILSGFRQVGNQANATQFLKSQALGGKGSQEVSRETIILITPIILSGNA